MLWELQRELQDQDLILPEKCVYKSLFILDFYFPTYHC